MQSFSNPLDTLTASLPPVFARTEVGRLTGGIVAPGTMANHDSRGTGPEGVFFVNRRACYRREAFVEWLKRHTGDRTRGKVGVAA